MGFSDAPGKEVHVYLAVLAGMLWLLTRHFADERNQEWAPLGILAGGLIGLQMGTLEIGILAGTFGFLLWSKRESGERIVWISSGAALMLFSSWASLLAVTYAAIGLIAFVSPLVLIDEQDIAQMTQESLRSCIGVVTQDTSLLLSLIHI